MRKMVSNNTDKKFTRDKKGKIKRIIETTLNLIAEKGYDNISTNHIAKASNLSIGTIYRYFPEGKSAVVMKASDIMFSKLPLKDIAFSIDTKDFKDFVKKIIKFYITSHRENLEMMKATDKATLSSREVRDELDIFIQKILQNTVKIFHKFPALENYSDSVIKEKFTLILKTVDGILHRHLFHNPFFKTDKELSSFLIELSLKIMEMD